MFLRPSEKSCVFCWWDGVIASAGIKWICKWFPYFICISRHHGSHFTSIITMDLSNYITLHEYMNHFLFIGQDQAIWDLFCKEHYHALWKSYHIISYEYVNDPILLNKYPDNMVLSIQASLPWIILSKRFAKTNWTSRLMFYSWSYQPHTECMVVSTLVTI